MAMPMRYMDEYAPIPNFPYELIMGEPQEYLDENSELESLMAYRSGKQEFNPGGQMQMPTGGTVGVPQQKPRTSNLDRVKQVLPVLADAAAAAVATPNRAYGGPADIASAFLSGRGAVEAHRQRQMMDAAWQADQARRDMDVQAELAYRQKQIEAEEARRQAAMREREEFPFVVAGNQTALNRKTGQFSTAPTPTQPPQKVPWQQRPIAERQAEAAAIGLSPEKDSYTYQFFLANGTMPPRPSQPGQQRQQQPHWVTAPDGRVQAVVIQDGKPVVMDTGARTAPPRSGGGRSGSSESTQMRREELEFRKAESAENRRQKELEKLEKDEQKHHEARQSWVRGDESDQNKVASYNKANAELRRIYKRKLDLRAITQEQYNRMVAELKDAGQPQQQSSTAAAPVAPGQPLAAPRSKYVVGRGFVE